MTTGRMSNDRCPRLVEAWINGQILENVASGEANVVKSSGSTTARVSDPPVFYVGGDNSRRCEGGAEMADVREVILGLPETAVDNEEQWKRSFALGKPELSELARIIAIANPNVEKRWAPIQDIVQGFSKSCLARARVLGFRFLRQVDLGRA